MKKQSQKRELRIGDDKSRAKKVRVTPKIAEEWLKKNTDNRPVSRSDVERLKSALTAGEWTVNGETIKFDENDVLRDGQGRLHAIAEGNISAVCWVIYGIPVNSFDTIDQGRKRTLGHILHRHGYKHYNMLAHAIATVYQHCNDDDIEREPGGLRTIRGLAIVQERPAIVESVAFVLEHNIEHITSGGMAAALHYLMKQEEKRIVTTNDVGTDDFFRMLGSGEINNKRSPVHVLRDIVLQNRGFRRDQRYTKREVTALTIKAWKKFMRGQTCTRLTWNAEREEFPKISLPLFSIRENPK